MQCKTQIQIITLGSVLLLGACDPTPLPVPPAGDTTAPTLAEVTPVPNNTYIDATPGFTFSSTEVGTITWGGSCASATTAATSGNNTVTLNSLSVGYYRDCTVKVTDAADNASAELVLTPFLVGKPYNDTGITKCGDFAYSYTGYTGSATHNNNVDCAAGASPSATQTQQGFEIANGLDAVPAGQDAVYGRDADATKNSDADGHKGFSFTKLKADGTPLSDQTQAWSDAGSEGANTQWSCVQDNVTGLVWEIKTNDGGLRDKDWTYTWYNTDSSNNGGDWGIGDTGVGTTTGYQFSAGTYAGSDNCYNNTRCDTAKYVADVNAAGLCGTSDWRLPTKEELQSMVAKDRSNPPIDSSFIPNTMGSSYWSSPNAGNSLNAWTVTFVNGGEILGSKSNLQYMRLVRGGY